MSLAFSCPCSSSLDSTMPPDHQAFLSCCTSVQLQMAWKEPEGCVFSLVTWHALGSEPGLYTAGKKPSCFCSLSSLSRLQPSLFCRPLDKPTCTEPESDFPLPQFSVSLNHHLGHPWIFFFLPSLPISIPLPVVTYAFTGVTLCSISQERLCTQ